MLTVRRRRPRCAFPLKSPSASRPCTSRSRFYLLDYHLQASHPFASFNLKHGSCISVHLLLCQQPFTCLSNTAICILYPAPSTMQSRPILPLGPPLGSTTTHCTAHCIALEQMSSATYRSKSASAGDPRLEQTRLLFGSESELLIAAPWCLYRVGMQHATLSSTHFQRDEHMQSGSSGWERRKFRKQSTSTR